LIRGALDRSAAPAAPAAAAPPENLAPIERVHERSDCHIQDSGLRFLAR
jgi:hypothetical protein